MLVVGSRVIVQWLLDAYKPYQKIKEKKTMRRSFWSIYPYSRRSNFNFSNIKNVLIRVRYK